MTFFIYPLVGIFAGLSSGLLGLGGGIVVVPALVLVFSLLGINDAISVHVAVGTSMATIIVTAISSFAAHLKRVGGQILRDLVWKLWPGMIIGAIIGVIIADHLSGRYLSIFFGFVALSLALRVILIKRRDGANDNKGPQGSLPRRFFLTLITTIIGAVSSVLGMGGGAFMVPFLQHCKVPMRYAVAMSASCSLPLAIVGTLSYLIVGQNETQHLSWSTGYIYWPAFIGIVMTSMIFAPIGAKLAYRFSPQTLRIIFVVFLAIVGVKMIIG